MSIWQLYNKNVSLQVARFDCGLIVMKGKAYSKKKSSCGVLEFQQESSRHSIIAEAN